MAAPVCAGHADEAAVRIAHAARSEPDSSQPRAHTALLVVARVADRPAPAARLCVCSADAAVEDAAARSRRPDSPGDCAGYVALDAGGRALETRRRESAEPHRRAASGGPGHAGDGGFESARGERPREPERRGRAAVCVGGGKALRRAARLRNAHDQLHVVARQRQRTATRTAPLHYRRAAICHAAAVRRPGTAARREAGD